MFYHRGSCHDVEALHVKIVALCAVFCLSTFGPCTMTRTQNRVSYDEYGSYRNDLGSGSENVLVGDNRASIPKLSLENVCRRPDSFCFPSTLSGFFSDFHSAKANVSGISEVKPEETLLVGSVQNNLSGSLSRGSYQLLNGNVVSCSLELKEGAHDTSYYQIDSSDQNEAKSCRTQEFNQNNEPLRIKTSPTDDFSSLDVQISHPSLDWGQRYLHFPSLAFLTIENRHNRIVLNVYEPYSTNPQFCPCNYSEISLGPGEVASICFVFLPKWLGSSSSHLILQTSSGGFLIRAQGYAVEPPYVIQPSVGLNAISLFNPSDKPLHVKEASAWMLFSSGNVSYSSKGVCSVVNHEGSELNRKQWLDVKAGHVGQPAMAMRPHESWTVGSNRNEPILELEFPYQKNVFGSFCVQLLSASGLDTIILEAEFEGRSVSNKRKIKSPLSISLETLTPCDTNETASLSLFLQNNGPDLLRVIKISTVGENTESFQTKYVEGLILFAHTVTQVATVAYSSYPHMNLNCKLLVQTNKSEAPELEVSCSDIAGFCSQALNYDNAETKSDNAHILSPFGFKAIEVTKADESVLGNWRSQGTENGKFVLDDDEVLFPMVNVGTHESKWISVVNPSDQPVIMQLLLNSGEIINECRGSDEISQPSSGYMLVLNGYTTPSRYGFSIAGDALTEAYVHPHGKAALGPIVFHPSSRCEWKTSALVRNNLSGVEWLSLRGSGGSVSLVLLDGSGSGSKPVRTLELNRGSSGFGHPPVKAVFAKNTGDLPLEVNRISVSGTKCELDGFVVRSCKGFRLQPGESRKLIISYRMEFCAERARRELELAMAGGILFVPMEASLSKSMLTICKRSLLLTRFKKFFLEILVFGLLISMAGSCMFSFIIGVSKTPSGHEEHPAEVCSKPETAQVTASSLPEYAGSLPENAGSLPENASSLLENASSLPESASSLPENASKPENLTVKTGKEKSRRRKKKRSSGGGVTGQIEASGSLSSNSAPPSPLSPMPSSTLRRSPELPPRSSTGHEEHPAEVRSTLETAQVTTSFSPENASSLPAPGPERMPAEPEESSRNDVIQKYYDILRDQLDPWVRRQSRAVPLPTFAEDSFFATSPQEFFEGWQLETVSSNQDG